MAINETSRQSSIAVCTLWEGDYHKGVGTLVNSLYRVGFRGKVWAGYRGELPSWARNGTTTDAIHSVQPAQGLEVLFVKLPTEWHFAHYKATYCKKVLEMYDPTAAGVYYFDPDIIVLGKWSFFVNWLEGGIAVCEDSHYPLNPSHPISLGWQKFAANHGLQLHRSPSFFVNSGLVGLKREYASFLDVWDKLIALAREEHGIGEALKRGARDDLFFMLDQDAFTIATWTTEYPVSLVGVDGMAFDRGVWLVLHAVANKKPWRRRTLRDTILDGTPPDLGSRMYWKNASSPLEVESVARVRLQKRLIPLAALLGRFYRRPANML